MRVSRSSLGGIIFTYVPLSCFENYAALDRVFEPGAELAATALQLEQEGHVDPLASAPLIAGRATLISFDQVRPVGSRWRA